MLIWSIDFKDNGSTKLIPNPFINRVTYELYI